MEHADQVKWQLDDGVVDNCRRSYCIHLSCIYVKVVLVVLVMHFGGCAQFYTNKCASYPLKGTGRAVGSL